MSWLLFALLGHLLNGCAFIIDKILLTQAFRRAGTYAGTIGIISLLAVVAAPWVTAWPEGILLWTALLSGALFVFALWGFFSAMAHDDAGRVVPIVGSLVPLFTFGGATFFLNEFFRPTQLLGFAALLLATIVLTSRTERVGFHGKTLARSAAAAFLFALSSLLSKHVYDAAGFLPGLILTRIGAAATGILLLSLLDVEAGREVVFMFQAKKKKEMARSRWTAALGLVGQIAGAAGFVLVQVAIAQGSVTLVNALQAIQYAFIVIVAVVLKDAWPQLLQEHVGARALKRKIVAVALAAFGLAFVR